MSRATSNPTAGWGRFRHLQRTATDCRYQSPRRRVRHLRSDHLDGRCSGRQRPRVPPRDGDKRVVDDDVTVPEDPTVFGFGGGVDSWTDEFESSPSRSVTN